MTRRTQSRWPRAAACIRSVGLVLCFCAASTLAPSGNVVLAPADAHAKETDPPIAPTTNPHGDLKLDCKLCHSAQAWKPARIGNAFDHSRFGFALDGAHARAECLLCHDSLEFTDTAAECAACHQDIHGGEFGVQCGTCHSSRSFIDHAAQLSMHRTTRFPLTGSHATADCDLCHTPRAGSSSLFVNTPAECHACHAAEYASAKDPDHARAGFSQDCSECHNSVAWVGGAGIGDHSFFPLRGGHGVLECGACHEGSSYAGTSRECMSCHEADYASTATPPHAAAGFSTDCGSCHSINSWNDSNFDHGTTSFALQGAHSNIDCADCHRGNVYTGLGADCFSCHEQDYLTTAEPNHLGAGYSTDCAACHGVTTWLGGTVDHSAFPLTTGHGGLDCTACHASGVFAGLNADCFFCHQTEYLATTNPAHQPAGFGSDCAVCHDTDSWLGATFDHETFFPLRSGPHREAANDCADCHLNPASYAQFSCVDCHDHNRSKMDDKHKGENGYAYDSVRCLDCHPRGRE